MSTTADIKSYLSAHPITLLYQLAVPKEFYYPTKSLVAVANGLVYTNCVKEEVSHSYGTKITIGDTARPIVSLKEVKGLDINNFGVLTDIPISSCTVASDGLSFTVTGALSTDRHYYKWNYDSSLSTVPAVTFVCASDLKGAVDETVKSLGKVSDAVDRVQDEVGLLSKRMIKAYPTKADCTIKAAGTQIMAVDLNYKVLTWDGTAWRDTMGTVVP